MSEQATERDDSDGGAGQGDDEQFLRDAVHRAVVHESAAANYEIMEFFEPRIKVLTMQVRSTADRADFVSRMSKQLILEGLIGVTRRHPSSYKACLTTTVVNAFNDEWRRKQKNRARSPDLVPLDEASDIPLSRTPLTDLERFEGRRRAAAELRALAAKARISRSTYDQLAVAVVELKYHSDEFLGSRLTTAKACELLDIGPDLTRAVTERISRLRSNRDSIFWEAGHGLVDEGGVAAYLKPPGPRQRPPKTVHEPHWEAGSDD